MVTVAVYTEQRVYPAVSEVLQEVFAKYPNVTDVVRYDETTDIATPVLVLGVMPTRIPAQYVKTISQKQVLARPSALTELHTAVTNLLTPPTFPAMQYKVVSALTPAEEQILGRVLVYDIETGRDIRTAVRPEEKTLLCVGINDGRRIYVYREESLLPGSAGYNQLRRIFTDPKRKLIAQNGKFDAPIVSHHLNIKITGHADTMLLHHAINIGAKEHGLKSLAQKYLGADEWEGDLKQYTRATHDYASIPRDVLYKYNAYDVYWTWHLWKYLERIALEDARVAKVAKFEFKMSRLFQAVEANGIAIDLPYLAELDKMYEAKDAQALTELRTLAGDEKFNPGSPMQVKQVFAACGVPLAKTDEKTLQALKLDGEIATLRDRLLDIRGYRKMRGTYVQGMLTRRRGNLVFPSYLIHGTATGRLSCVSGDTLLTTSRGTFTFAEYVPEQGDLVLTHKGDWKPVLRKIYKGVDKMFRVCLTNNAEITVSAAHRFYTPGGWKSLRELSVGDEVYYVGIQEVHKQSRQYQASARSVFKRRASNFGRVSITGENDVSQCAIHCSDTSYAGAFSGRKGASVLTIQNGGQESYDGKNGRQASALEGRYFGSKGLFDDSVGRYTSLLSQARYGRSAWPYEIASSIRRASYRQQPIEQRFGQLGLSDASRSRAYSPEVFRIKGYASVGTLSVWDIEVADDHSYIAQGFVNHNSKDPGIQTIPRDKVLRSIFVPRAPGRQLIQVDYSQAELRVMACLSGDPYLQSLFQRDSPDFFDALMPVAYPTIELDSLDSGTRKQLRARLKGIIYGLSYGRQARAISQALTEDAPDAPTTVHQAQSIIDNYFLQAPKLFEWRQEVTAIALDPDRSLVSPFGRQYQAEVITSGSRQGIINSALAFLPQGTASDICVSAAIRVQANLETGEYGDTVLAATIHDALLLDAPNDRVDQVGSMVQYEMEESGRRVFGDQVVFAAEPGHGKNWAEA